MVKHINLQFHSTSKESKEFISKICQKLDVNIAILRFVPEFSVQEITVDHDILKELKSLDGLKYRSIVFNLKSFVVDVESQKEFYELNPQALTFEIGEESKDVIRESWLHTSIYMDDIDSQKCWQKIARELKKISTCGAWAMNPKTNGRHFYKNHRYTEGIKAAQKKGLKILPSAGIIEHDFLSPPPTKD
ncbi:MAG: hypothetical protein KC646_10215 [Candidatus Cloacimonetes bacterium]|nr:hypothetical protein [Candidatus Cloacimonadota bacterium]